MAQVSIGQVKNLEDLARGLETVHDSLELACRELIATADDKFAEAREEAQNSRSMLERVSQAEQKAQQAADEAHHSLNVAKEAFSAAECALSACKAQPADGDGKGGDCSGEEGDVDDAQVAVAETETAVAAAQTVLAQATENRQKIEHRVEWAGQALAMAEKALEQSQQECTVRMGAVRNAIETGKARLTAAQHALEGYLATNPPAAQFRSWLNWHPQRSKPATPDVICDRMKLSIEQQAFLQEYLYDRVPGYRELVNKYRCEWESAKGDVERNMVNRNVRIHLSGEFAEQMARHALAPLGGRIETQARTFVGYSGRYTKTDLIVRELRVPVILGRGDGMGAPVGGAIAFEVKCGKSDYLNAQKGHMTFQAEGHKQADARCTLCSRDIHDLPADKEKELREAMHDAGSPMVGMLPRKNEIDQSCLKFVRQGTKEEQK